MDIFAQLDASPPEDAAEIVWKACASGQLRVDLSWRPLDELPAHVKAAIIDPTCGHREMTPLHIACENGHVDAVRFLLSHGAASCLWHRDRSGRAPHHHAAMRGHTDVLKALFEPDVLLASRAGAHLGHLNALRSELLELSTCLLVHLPAGSDARAAKYLGFRQASRHSKWETWDSTWRARTLEDAHERYNCAHMTALQLAMHAGPYGFVKSAPAPGDDDVIPPPFSPSQCGRVVDVLLQLGASPDTSAANDNATTPVMRAIIAHDVHALAVLLRHGARVDSAAVGLVAINVQNDYTATVMTVMLDRCGRTSLNAVRTVIQKGRYQMLNVLLAHGLNPNTVLPSDAKHHKRCLLHLVLESSVSSYNTGYCLRMFAALLRAGADVHTRSSVSLTIPFTTMLELCYREYEQVFLPILVAHAGRNDADTAAQISRTKSIMKYWGPFASYLQPHCDLIRTGQLLHLVKTTCRTASNSTAAFRASMRAEFALMLSTWAFPRRIHALHGRRALLQRLYAAHR